MNLKQLEVRYGEKNDVNKNSKNELKNGKMSKYYPFISECKFIST